MNSIGLKQTVLLVVLAAMTGAFYYYSYIHLAPAQRIVKTKVSVKQGEISTMRQEMTELKNGFNKFLDYKQKYDNIVSLGFFDDQNRLEAQKLIQLIQEKSRVISAKYAIRPLKQEDNERAEAADHNVVATEIDFNIDAVEDSDIYDFFFMLTQGFPGHIEVRNFSITKVADVTQPLLRKIGSGDPEAVVQGTISITWRTLRKNENEEEGSTS